MATQQGEVLEQGKLLAADHVLGFLRQGHVHGDEVGMGKEVIHFLHNLDLQGLCLAGRDIGIVGKHLHPEGNGPAGDLGSNTTHSKDGDGLTVKLHSLEFLTIPLACLHAGVGLRNVAGGCEHK